MKRPLAVLVALLTLGCSGAPEWAFEATTGGTLELSEDGMVMIMEDGSEVISHTGENVLAPEDFPIPEPWPEAKPLSVTITKNVDGDTFTMISYALERPTEEVLALYDAWLDERGATDVHGSDETAMGMRTAVRVAKDAGDGTPIMINVSEFFGQNTVNIGYGKGPKNHEI